VSRCCNAPDLHSPDPARTSA